MSVQVVTLGSLACLAGASFMLPNRMNPLIKAAMGISYVILGALYVAVNVLPAGIGQREMLLELTLLVLALSVLVSNVGAYVVERLRVRALKKNALPFGRRSDDPH